MNKKYLIESIKNKYNIGNLFITKLIVIFSLFFTNTIFANAQVEFVRYLQPSNNEIDVPILPEIFIFSDYRIDTTGIVNYYPVYDSTVTSATPPPIFSLIEKCGNDSLSIDILKEVTLQCNYTIIGTNIIKIVPQNPLLPGKTYTGFLTNLKVIVPIGDGNDFDTIVAPMIEVNFTTTKLPHYVSYTSFDYYPRFRCMDTLKIVFNRELEYGSYPLNQIVLIDKVDSIGTNGRYYTSVNVDHWIDANNDRILKVKPINDLEIDQLYRMRIKPSIINGDTLYDKEYFFYNSDVAPITINATTITGDTINGDLVTPGIGVFTYKANDSTYFNCERYYNNYVFSKWKLVDFYGNETFIENNFFYLYKSCTELVSYSITAIYEIFDTVDLQVYSRQGYSVKVIDSNNQILGAEGTYQLAPLESVEIVIDSIEAGYPQCKLKSKYTDNMVGNVADRIKVINDRGIGIITDIPEDPFITDQYFGLSVSVISSANNCESYIQVYNKIGPVGKWSTTDNPPPPQFHSVTIMPEFIGLVRITKIVKKIGANTTTIPFPLPGNAWSESIIPTDPTTYVEVYIEPITFTVTIETDIIKHSIFSNPQIGKNKDVTIGYVILNCKSDWNSMHQKSITYTDAPFISIPNVPAGAMIRFIINEQISNDLIDRTTYDLDGFNFNGWDNSSTYTVPVSNYQYGLHKIVTSDLNFKGIFQEYFRIEKFGIYENDNHNQVNWYFPRDFYNKSINDKFNEIEVRRFDLPGLNDEGYLTRLSFKFNNILDYNRLYNDNGISCNELSDRVDYDLKKDYFTNANNSSYLPAERILTFDLTQNYANYAIPKGQTFLLKFKSCYLPSLNPNGKHSYSVFDIDGKYLNTHRKSEFILNTELPGIINKMEYITAYKSEDYYDNTNESYTEIYTDVIEFKKDDVEYKNPQNIASFDPDLVKNEEKLIDRLLLNYPNMNRNCLHFISFLTLDTDNGQLPPLYEEYRNAVKLALGIFLGISEVPGDDLSTPIMPAPTKYEFSIIPYLIIQFLDVFVDALVNILYSLGYLLSGSGDPDFMANGEFLYDWHNDWFGSKFPHYRKDHYSNYTNYDMLYKGKVYLRKSDDINNLDTYYIKY